MSPLNRGPLMGPRIPPSAMRPPMPRFGRVPPPPPPGMARPMPPPPINPMFGIRGRPIPPPPPRPGPMMGRPGGPVCPPIFPRGRPLPPLPPMGLRGPMVPRGPLIRPGPRGILPPHVLPHMRPRFPPNHVNGKGKMNAKKANKLEELELKKPWMTDEIRSEIQKKNKLYAKAKKNKDAKEWEEFKDLRNKVTRMIRDAKNEYLAKNPEQALHYESDEAYPEANEADDDDDFHGLPTDSADEEDEPNNLYCEVCDKDFKSEELLKRHIGEHRTCSIDGCTFTAHPKIVEKHISMQHRTGLYHKMKNLSSHEDIEKWKAERKRLYPTKANIELKEAAQLEKEDRGEVVERRSDKTRGRFKNRPDNLRRNRKRKRNKLSSNCDNSKFENAILYRGLQPFAGTGAFEESGEGTGDSEGVSGAKKAKALEAGQIEISDEESEVKGRAAETNDPSKKAFSLVADYESNTDDDEPPDEVSSKSLALNENAIATESPEPEPQPQPEPEPQPEQQIELTNVTEALQDNATGAVPCPEATRPKKTRVERNSKKNNEKLLPKSNRDNGKYSKKTTRTSQNSGISKGRLTLLNKLLARSIQNERNAIFQCIKFIANNHFFD